jgi:hypothetical protein
MVSRLQMVIHKPSCKVYVFTVDLGWVKAE